MRRAVQGTAPGDQTTQWPQAHFLSPLHPVLDWAVDRALTRLGRNEVPVITAARRHAGRAGAGDADQRPRPGGAAGARGMRFLAPDLPPIVDPDVPGLLEAIGLRAGPPNPNRPLDLAGYQPLVPAAVREMQPYMNTLKRERAGTLSEPLREAAGRSRPGADVPRRARRSWRRRTRRGYAAASSGTAPRPTSSSSPSARARIRWCASCS